MALQVVPPELAARFGLAVERWDVERMSIALLDSGYPSIRVGWPAPATPGPVQLRSNEAT